MNNEELAKKHGVYWKYENSLENFCAALTQEKDATIKDLEAHFQEVSDASIGLSEKDAHIEELEKHVRNMALARERDAVEIARLRGALEEIAYMGMDCPMQGDRDYFNESQLRKCVSIGANALAKKKDTT